MLTRNPAYILLLLGVVVLHYIWIGRDRPEARGWQTLLRLAAGLSLFIIPFNALGAHDGAHVLFALPSGWPIVGGNITLEAIAWGACSAFSLLTLMALFATFNLQIDQAQMLRLTPAFVYEAGLIVSIALTFIPQMVLSAREIREAQLIRGHRIRRVRDMLPLLMALLTTGLEHSFQLAESMEARGFGNVRALPRGRDLVYKALVLVSLAGILGGFFALTYAPAWRWAGGIAASISAAFLLAVFWAQGKRVLRTRYQRERWTWRDGIVLAACIAAATALAWARMRGEMTLAYDPYTSLLPGFQPWLGAALSLLIVPIFAGFAREAPRPVPKPTRHGREHKAKLTSHLSGLPDLHKQARDGPAGIIELDDLNYSYPAANAHDAPAPVLRDLTFRIERGEFVLVVGPSGAGKSTLLRCLNGLVPHFYGGTIGGSIRIAGRDPIALEPRRMSEVVGLVFQDPEAQAVMDVVEDELAFALENQGIGYDDMRARIETVLAQLNIAHLRRRRISTLSGGERQRVAIAAVLTLRPQVIALDEPTSQLDPQAAEEVIDILVKLNRELGLTIVLSEHRLERVIAHVGRILYLPGGSAPPILGDPQRVLAQIPLTPPLIDLGKHMEWSPLPLTIDDARGFVQALSLAGGRAWVETLHARKPVGRVEARRSPAGPLDDEALLELHNVHFGYGREQDRPDSEVLRGIDLQVGRGEFVAIMGHNGAGKSTLLKQCIGLLKPQQGQVRAMGFDTRSTPVEDLARHVGYVPQNPNALLFADTLAQELAFTRRAQGLPPAEPLTRDRRALTRSGDSPPASAPDDDITLLEALGLAGMRERYPRDLSVGERQRVALAAVLVGDPDLILLDEPTRGLDYPQKEALIAFLKGLRASKTVIVVTHDVELVAQCAERIVLLEGGRIVQDGPARQVMTGSPAFASQINRLFGDPRFLTVQDVLEALAPRDRELENPAASHQEEPSTSQEAQHVQA
jgi:energy-coupling factor transporter ATP-binding protein EcfA2/energy-coupling factor transporter transmembrane protein EcfT